MLVIATSKWRISERNVLPNNQFTIIIQFTVFGWCNTVYAECTVMHIFTLILQSTVPSTSLQSVQEESYTIIGKSVENMISSNEIDTKYASSTGKMCGLLKLISSNGHFTSAKVINDPSVVKFSVLGWIWFWKTCEYDTYIKKAMEMQKLIVT